MSNEEKRFLLVGPQGIGKTRHASRIACALGATTIIDDFIAGAAFPSATLAISNSFSLPEFMPIDVVMFAVFSEKALMTLIETIERKKSLLPFSPVKNWFSPVKNWPDLQAIDISAFSKLKAEMLREIEELYLQDVRSTTLSKPDDLHIPGIKAEAPESAEEKRGWQ